MNDVTNKDYLTLAKFWNNAFFASKEDLEKERQELTFESYLNDSVPSEKIKLAVESMAKNGSILDYGCGAGWASIVLAKAGCKNVTAVEVSENGKAMTDFYANLFNVEKYVHTAVISSSWITKEPSEKYEGIVCSNVLDVVPTKMALEIISNMARIVKKGSKVVVGLNFYLTPDRAREKGVVLEDGERLYTDGVLRMVNRTDEQWSAIFSKYFNVISLDHFAWPGEEKETRRLFCLEAGKI